MRPLPFVWPYALVFWAVNVWAFLPERKILQGGFEGAKRADSKDSSYMKVILGGTSGSGLRAVGSAGVGGTQRTS